jgi:hypothetical protein
MIEPSGYMDYSEEIVLDHKLSHLKLLEILQKKSTMPRMISRDGP